MVFTTSFQHTLINSIENKKALVHLTTVSVTVVQFTHVNI